MGLSRRALLEFACTLEPSPGLSELLEELSAPMLQTFRFVYPNGKIAEWDGTIALGRMKDDGTIDAECSVLSVVREGSIYDKEGAD